MLNQRALNGMWDLMRQKHGITLRLIESLPEDKLHAHPIPGMRTPAELIVHMYNVLIDGSEGRRQRRDQGGRVGREVDRRGAQDQVGCDEVRREQLNAGNNAVAATTTST